MTARISNLTIAAAGNNDGNGSSNDDDYYLTTCSENPRMAYYRYYRVNNCQDEYRKMTSMAAYDSITQDELNYELRRVLLKPPEQRYQERKKNWFFHDSSAYARGLDREVGYGCNGLECVSDCRYAAEDGRIEAEEIVAEFRERETEYRKRNKIVNIEIDERDYNKFLKVWNNIIA